MLSGSGRIRVGNDLHELAPRDAVRVAPGIERGLAAGPDGLEVLVVGPRCQGDGELLEGWSVV